MGPRDASTLCRLDAAQSQFQSHKDKYEKLRADVAIKLKFLEENKVGRHVGLGRGCGAGVCCVLVLSLSRATLQPPAEVSPWVGGGCEGTRAEGHGSVRLCLPLAIVASAVGPSYGFQGQPL